MKYLSLLVVAGFLLTACASLPPTPPICPPTSIQVARAVDSLNLLTDSSHALKATPTFSSAAVHTLDTFHDQSVRALVVSDHNLSSVLQTILNTLNTVVAGLSVAEQQALGPYLSIVRSVLQEIIALTASCPTV